MLLLFCRSLGTVSHGFQKKRKKKFVFYIFFFSFLLQHRIKTFAKRKSKVLRQNFFSMYFFFIIGRFCYTYIRNIKYRNGRKREHWTQEGGYLCFVRKSQFARGRKLFGRVLCKSFSSFFFSFVNDCSLFLFSTCKPFFSTNF